MNKPATGLGHTIRLLQEVSGKTNKQLSEDTGIQEATIARYRQDKNIDPKFSTLHKLSLAFGLTVDQFMNFSNKVNDIYIEEVER